MSLKTEMERTVFVEFITSVCAMSKQSGRTVEHEMLIAVVDRLDLAERENDRLEEERTRLVDRIRDFEHRRDAAANRIENVLRGSAEVGEITKGLADCLRRIVQEELTEDDEEATPAKAG